MTTALAIGLFIAPQAYAEERTLAGEVSLSGMLTDVNGNNAKFNEYRDLRDGVYGKVKLLYDTDAWWLKADYADIGYDTQRYDLQGGLWGAFKADLFYREIPHNITFGANNPTTFPTSFDYSTKRKQGGGSFSLDVIKPFFFNVSATTEKKRGEKPAGASLDFGNSVSMELPEPIEYRTNIIKADFGYSQKPLFADIYFMYSDFDNKNSVFNFFNTTSAATDQLTLPPDNKYYKVGFKGSVKLPYNTRFSINGGWSETTSTASLLNTDPLLGALTPTDLTFHGKVDTQNLDVALNSNPIDFLDGKIFYKYYNRDNKSDVITQQLFGFFDFTNRLFDYKKNQFGGELGFKLPMKFYLSTGYTHIVTDRSLDTLADTSDDVYSFDLRWKGLDFMTVRTGYERLVRNADFHTPIDRTLINPFNPAIPFTGARNFDLADKTRDTIKLSADLYPTDYLSIGVGYKHKETKYKELLYGLKSDRSDEIFTNADLMIGSALQLFGYFDYQQTRRNMDQFDGSFGAPTGTSADSLATWNMKDKETYYDFGAGTNIFLVPKKLTMRLQYDYSRNNGNADLTLGDTLFTGAGTALPVGATQSNIDIPNWDDYTKQTIMAKLIYDVTKHISVAIGYAYEKFKYSDAQLDGYQLIPTDGGAYLTGAYANQSYNANVYFATLTYKFW